MLVLILLRFSGNSIILTYGSLVPEMKSLAGSSTARITFRVSVDSIESYFRLNSMRPLPFDSPSSVDSWSREISQ